MTRRWIVFGIALATAGCEAKAQREDLQSARRSSAHESCAATADCEEPLRCLAGVCRTGQRSDIGDYHLAAGTRALGQSNAEAAITQLRDAERQYKNEKLDVPPEVHCALGAALTRLRSDPLKAEEGAAKLHRCLSGLPDGSPLRRRALEDLAALGEVGFDPTHLGSDEVADRYLTAAPTKPPLEKLTIAASAERKSNKKSFEQWMTALAGEEVKSALAPCWSAWWKATKKKELVITLPWRYSFFMHPEVESLDRGKLEVYKHQPSSSAELAAAESCAIDALDPIAAELASRGGEHSWRTNITLTIAP
jgi:hypothetical protein